MIFHFHIAFPPLRSILVRKQTLHTRPAQRVQKLSLKCTSWWGSSHAAEWGQPGVGATPETAGMLRDTGCPCPFGSTPRSASVATGHGMLV